MSPEALRDALSEVTPSDAAPSDGLPTSAAVHPELANSPAAPAPSPDPAHHGAASVDRGRLVRAVAVYTGLRVGLMIVLTVALMWVMPLIVALAFAVVLQLPLAFLLFPRQRHGLTAALAGARSRRGAERDRLRAALTGKDAPET